jgi:hypothetical protein
MAHPADGPDLAARGFFLFGIRKEKLREYEIPHRACAKCTIIHILNNITHENLMAILASWIKRFKWMRKHNGEQFHKAPEKER